LAKFREVIQSVLCGSGTRRPVSPRAAAGSAVDPPTTCEQPGWITVVDGLA